MGVFLHLLDFHSIIAEQSEGPFLRHIIQNDQQQSSKKDQDKVKKYQTIYSLIQRFDFSPQSCSALQHVTVMHRCMYVNLAILVCEFDATTLHNTFLCV